MSDIAIRVDGIGKKYKLGKKKSGDFRESFAHFWDTIRFRQNGNGQQEKSEFWALKDISFEVKKGEAVGIIGRNGAGKSTLLKVLSRITKPTTGRFEINGRVSSLLEVGTGFHPELTGRENIYLNGTILGMRRAEIKAKFDEIVAFSGVEDFIDTPVKHYSSGMKVRLAFSVAAHLEPEILIIDEVLAVGDAEFQRKCLGKMEDVAGEGRTVLFVSHNMGAVRSLCRSSIVLYEGKVILNGYSSDAISKYLDFANDKNIQSIFPITSNCKGLTILDIKILNEYNKCISEVFAGEIWKVGITIKTYRKLVHLIHALGIVTIEDQPIRTIFSTPKDYSEGIYEIFFTIDDVYLAAHKYNLLIGFSERDQAILSVSDSLSITIVENLNKSVFHRSGSKNGYIINKGVVNVNKICLNAIKK